MSHLINLRLIKRLSALDAEIANLRKENATLRAAIKADVEDELQLRTENKVLREWQHKLREALYRLVVEGHV